MATTSTTITFSTETSVAGASLQVELDEVRNDEKTKFLYDTKAYFRVYPFPTDLTLTIAPSDGSVANEAGGLIQKTELVTFANEKEASTQFAIQSIISSKWFGNSLGAISASGGNVIRAASEGVAVLEITYTTLYVGKSLTLPFRAEPEYPVVVFILGE